VGALLALGAAAVVATLHMLYLVYMVFGGFLALYRFAWIWPSIISTLYSIYVTVTDFKCPVTAVEKWLLVRGGRTPYEGSFTAHYLRGTLYPAEYETAVWLTGMGIAVASYAIVISLRWRRRRGLAHQTA
jgi:hypothetical protein